MRSRQVVSPRFNLVAEIGIIIVVLTLEAVLLSSRSLPSLDLVVVMAASGASLAVVPFVIARRMSPGGSAEKRTNPSPDTGVARQKEGVRPDSVSAEAKETTREQKGEPKGPPAAGEAAPAPAAAPTPSPSQGGATTDRAHESESVAELKKVVERLDKIDNQVVTLSGLLGMVITRLPGAPQEKQSPIKEPSLASQNEAPRATPRTDEPPRKGAPKDGMAPVLKAIKVEEVGGNGSSSEEPVKVNVTSGRAPPQGTQEPSAAQTSMPTNERAGPPVPRVDAAKSMRSRELTELDELRQELAKLRSKFDSVGGANGL